MYASELHWFHAAVNEASELVAFTSAVIATAQEQRLLEKSGIGSLWLLFLIASITPGSKNFCDAANTKLERALRSTSTGVCNLSDFFVDVSCLTRGYLIKSSPFSNSVG